MYSGCGYLKELRMLWRSGDQRHWASLMYEFCSNIVHMTAPALEAFVYLQGGLIHLIGVSHKIGFLCTGEKPYCPKKQFGQTSGNVCLPELCLEYDIWVIFFRA